MSATSELNFSRPVSLTADHPVQDTSLINRPENSSYVAIFLNHLEMLSQYTRPGVAISVAQQEALYRENLQAQLQPALSDRRLEQAHSPSGSVVVNPANQIPVNVQNVASPTLPPPMQPPRQTTLVMASSNSNIFVLDFQANPKANQNIDQPAVHVGPKRCWCAWSVASA